jgi:hypothetical protein
LVDSVFGFRFGKWIEGIGMPFEGYWPGGYCPGGYCPGGY